MTVNDAATTVQLSPLTPRTLGPNRPAVAANSPADEADPVGLEDFRYSAAQFKLIPDAAIL